MRTTERCVLSFVALLLLAASAFAADAPEYRDELVFPLNPKHNHAPGVVECPNGDLLVSWYRGSGERSADDVAVLGARLPKGSKEWSEPFLLADFPEFPDCNTCMMIDKKQQLWVFWPIILDNNWSSCLTNYRVSSDYNGPGAPKWNWQGVIFLKPKDFKDKAMSAFHEQMAKASPALQARIKPYQEELEKRLSEKLSQRLGWQPRCKPTVLSTGRILLPLYSDTYSFSIMAVSDDDGASWYASDVLIGFGNIQPAVLERKDGSVVAYMRENGITDKIRVCESSDGGLNWGPVGELDLPNPGSGLDAVRLDNGHWAMIYNDTIKGRSSLAVSISEDEGRTWPITRHLEKHDKGSFHYPAIIQSADGTLHAVYSYFVRDGDDKEGKSMKHAAFNEAWLKAGDPK